jgi:hypothetical protein
MKLNSFLLVTVAHAYLVFESIWKPQDCKTPPSAMYLFEINNLNAKAPSANGESWPPSFAAFKDLMPIGTCPSYYQIPSSSHCCFTWLEANTTHDIGPFQSATFDLVAPTLTLNYPISSKGYKFCLLEGSQSGTLFNYIQLYIRDGECVEGISCSDGKLVIYPYTFGYRGCAKGHDSPETYTLKSSPTFFNSTVAGMFMARVMTITEAGLVVDWKSYLPDTLLYPTFVEKWEYVGAIAIVWSMIMKLATVGYFGYKYQQSPNRVSLAHAIGQSLWLLSIILQLFYINVFLAPDSRILH